MQVRPAVPADFEAWLPLWDGYNRFYGRAGATALPEEVTRTTWSRFHDPAEPMRAFVAEVDGELVGLAHVVLHRSTTLLGPTCYLQDLFTAEKARGRGIARALIDAAAAFARSQGALRLYWQTHETNDVARRLYDQVAVRTGFIVYRKALA